MKKHIISLGIISSILLTGCGDPEANQAEKLAFNEENYTYNERIREHENDESYSQFYKEYESVLCEEGSTVPILQVKYDVVNEVLMSNEEYWYFPNPQGVISIYYEGDLDIGDTAINELAKPIIDHMNENEMFHAEYGVDFVKTIDKHSGYTSDPLIYNQSTDDFVIKDSGTGYGYKKNL